MAPSETINTILSDERVTALQDIMDRYDGAANSAQTVFKNFSFVFIFATAAATLSAALILFGSGAGVGDGSHPVAIFLKNTSVQNLLFVVQVAFLGTAAFAAHVQETRQHANRWSGKRRLAEETRIELFEAVFFVANEAGQDSQVAAFDYFLSQQLDGQIRYFDKAQVRHDNTASKLATLGAVVAGVVAIAGVSGYSEYWLPIAALAGVVAPVFLMALNSWRDTGNDAQKATRYSEVWIALRRLKGQSDIVKRSLASGDVAAANA